MTLVDSYEEEQLENDSRIVMKIKPFLAPYTIAVLPLSKQLNEKAKEINKILCNYFSTTYDETGSIGKRYRRQDAIGTPFCITVDFETSDDQSVTVRDRDTMKQIRMPISDLQRYFSIKIFM